MVEEAADLLDALAGVSPELGCGVSEDVAAGGGVPQAQVTLVTLKRRSRKRRAETNWSQGVDSNHRYTVLQTVALGHLATLGQPQFSKPFLHPGAPSIRTRERDPSRPHASIQRRHDALTGLATFPYTSPA